MVGTCACSIASNLIQRMLLLGLWLAAVQLQLRLEDGLLMLWLPLQLQGFDTQKQTWGTAQRLSVLLTPGHSLKLWCADGDKSPVLDWRECQCSDAAQDCWRMSPNCWVNSFKPYSSFCHGSRDKSQELWLDPSTWMVSIDHWSFFVAVFATTSEWFILRWSQWTLLFDSTIVPLYCCLALMVAPDIGGSFTFTDLLVVVVILLGHTLDSSMFFALGLGRLLDIPPCISHCFLQVSLVEQSELDHHNARTGIFVYSQKTCKKTHKFVRRKVTVPKRYVTTNYPDATLTNEHYTSFQPLIRFHKHNFRCSSWAQHTFSIRFWLDEKNNIYFDPPKWNPCFRHDR